MEYFRYRSFAPATECVTTVFLKDAQSRVGAADGELCAIPMPTLVDTVDALDAWLQTIPRPQKICELEDTVAELPEVSRALFIEVLQRIPFRLGDQDQHKAAWRAAVSSMAWRIYAEAMRLPGEIIWRILPEFSEIEWPVFLRYGNDGPDKDYTEYPHNAWADQGYSAIAGYARFAVLSAPRAQ